VRPHILYIYRAAKHAPANRQKACLRIRAHTVGLAAAEKLPSNSPARLHMYVTLASRVSSRETGKPQASMRRLLGSSDYWSLRAVTRHKRPQNHNDIPVRRPHYATPQVSLSLASPLFYPPTTRVNEQRKKRKKKKRKEKKNPGVKKKKKKRNGFFFPTQSQHIKTPNHPYERIRTRKQLNYTHPPPSRTSVLPIVQAAGAEEEVGGL